MTAAWVDAGRPWRLDDLPAQAANDAVKAVEDAIDAHLRTTPAETYPLDGEQGPAVVLALLDLGWRPPA